MIHHINSLSRRAQKCAFFVCNFLYFLKTWFLPVFYPVFYPVFDKIADFLRTFLVGNKWKEE